MLPQGTARRVPVHLASQLPAASGNKSDTLQHGRADSSQAQPHRTASRQLEPLAHLHRDSADSLQRHPGSARSRLQHETRPSASDDQYEVRLAPAAPGSCACCTGLLAMHLSMPVSMFLTAMTYKLRRERR